MNTEINKIEFEIAKLELVKFLVEEGFEREDAEKAVNDLVETIKDLVEIIWRMK